jgi:quercetin dioxygenase-like cupin family protein
MQTELAPDLSISQPASNSTIKSKVVLIDGIRVYVSQIPQGMQIKIKPMPIQRIVIVGQGTIILENNGQCTKYVAPAHCVLDAHYYYNATTVEDTVIYETMPTTETSIAKLDKSPGERVIDFSPEHFFSEGVYAKKWTIPANTQVASHKHIYDHMSVLAVGHVTVTVDGDTVEYTAPAVLDIKKNLTHTIRAYEDSVWFCIHATSETDIDKIDIYLEGDTQ